MAFGGLELVFSMAKNEGEGRGSRPSSTPWSGEPKASPDNHAESELKPDQFVGMGSYLGRAKLHLSS
jgi:hypothetical protein